MPAVAGKQQGGEGGKRGPSGVGDGRRRFRADVESRVQIGRVVDACGQKAHARHDWARQPRLSGIFSQIATDHGDFFAVGPAVISSQSMTSLYTFGVGLDVDVVD